MADLQQKFNKLKALLREMESVVIGYSGGVDSTFLAKVATDELGGKALCAIAISESYPEHERRDAENFANDLGLNIVTVNTSEIDNPEYQKNDSMRCYHCKKEMISHLRHVAKQQNIQTIAIGTNYDDLGDFRPGQRAAKEENVRSPLVEAEMTKEDIRALSKEMGIPTWNKPSFACLSSRVAYGESISREKLEKIDKAEAALREYGFTQFRVRHHDSLARIEVLADEMELLLKNRVAIAEKLRSLGYTHVSMDLLGYRTGSMNEALHQIASPAMS